ncbi:hypothetical protein CAUPRSCDRAFT_10806 [Caulochytrium protostelioides]|uniref:Uncharacterized protein n=1 Tax=Caulochytrium protostelioides TaxID=1555241 RepID=A0A4V1ITM0_9FUNG|nr:hypothetical protein CAUPRSCDRAFT_10806 [Caulochytrium protostelioides]
MACFVLSGRRGVLWLALMAMIAWCMTHCGALAAPAPPHTMPIRPKPVPKRFVETNPGVKPYKVNKVFSKHRSKTKTRDVIKRNFTGKFSAEKVHLYERVRDVIQDNVPLEETFKKENLLRLDLWLSRSLTPSPTRQTTTSVALLAWRQAGTSHTLPTSRGGAGGDTTPHQSMDGRFQLNSSGYSRHDGRSSPCPVASHAPAVLCHRSIAFFLPSSALFI